MLFVKVEDAVGSMVVTAATAVGCAGENLTWVEAPDESGLIRVNSLTAFGVKRSSSAFAGAAVGGAETGLGADLAAISFNASVASASDPNGITATPLMQ